MQIEKTIFIAHRLTSSAFARMVKQYLVRRGYDVFMYDGALDPNVFDQITPQEIKARAHFLIIFAPSTSELLSDSQDWLRQQIEIAIDFRRNIIPLLFNNASLNDATPYLTGKLAQLRQYNALNVPSEFFDEAMNRLHTRFLNTAVDVTLYPPAHRNQPSTKQPDFSPELLSIDIAPKSTPIPNIFISHSTNDAQAFVTPLYYGLLATQKYTLFKAPETILPGETWVDAIQRGLTNMTHFLLILSPSSVTSSWVKLEVETAIERERRNQVEVIPILYQQATIPLLWGRYQFLTGNSLQTIISAVINRIP